MVKHTGVSESRPLVWLPRSTGEVTTTDSHTPRLSSYHFQPGYLSEIIASVSA